MNLPKDFFVYLWLGIAVFYFFVADDAGAGVGCLVMSKLSRRDY